MCTSPYQIPNPNYGIKFKAGDVNSLKDCTSRYINVPCGHCDECIHNKQLQLVQRIQMESLVNHVFYATITYNNDMIPFIVTSTGYRIRYFSYVDLKNMIKRLRKDNAFRYPFRYLVVSERGHEKGRPHAHLLFFISKDYFKDFNDVLHQERIMYDTLLNYWSRNIGTNRKPIYVPCCTYYRKFIRGKWSFNYDLHYVRSNCSIYKDASPDNVAWYVLKYMLKTSDREMKLQQALRLNLSDDEYKDVWSLVRSRCFISKGFGISTDYKFRQGLGKPNLKIVEYIKDCVSRSASNGDKSCNFYNHWNGKTFPLSSYFKKFPELFSLEDALKFYYNDADSPFIDTPILPDKIRNRDDDKRKFTRFARQHDLVNQLSGADLFDELF